MFEVVSMQGCGPCKQLKETMKERGIPFTEFDVKTRGDKRLQELKTIMMKEGVEYVPVLFHKGTIMGIGAGAQQYIDSMEK